MSKIRLVKQRKGQISGSEAAGTPWSGSGKYTDFPDEKSEEKKRENKERNLFVGVRVITNINKVVEDGRVDLFHFAGKGQRHEQKKKKNFRTNKVQEQEQLVPGDEHGRDAHQLQLLLCDIHERQEPVNDIDSEVKRLVAELELHRDLHQPINQN